MIKQSDCLQQMENSEVQWGSEWGGGDLSLAEKSNASLKLKYCMQAIALKSGKLLEIGCGQGRFLRAIQNYSNAQRSYFGCDIEVQNLQKIPLTQRKEDDIFYSAGDISRLPFASASFDVVVFFDVLEHVMQLEESIGELARITKPGAILHTFIPCEGNLWTLHGLFFKLGIARNLKRELAGHIQQLVTNEVMNLFLAHDFELERVRYSGYLLEQFFDLMFYTGLKFSPIHSILAQAHTDATVGVNQKTESGFRKAAVLFFRMVKNVMFGIAYYESLLFAKFPYSLGIHVTFKRRRMDDN